MTEGRQPFTAEIKTLAKGPSTYDPFRERYASTSAVRCAQIAAIPRWRRERVNSTQERNRSRGRGGEGRLDGLKD